MNIDTGSGFVISPFYQTVTISPPAATAPVLISPANNAATTDVSPTFSWNPSTSTAGLPYNYQIQVDNNQNFSSPVVDITVAATSYTTGDLPTGLYYW